MGSFIRFVTSMSIDRRQKTEQKKVRVMIHVVLEKDCRRKKKSLARVFRCDQRGERTETDAENHKDTSHRAEFWFANAVVRGKGEVVSRCERV
jgi:hypothetical protein